MHENHTWHQILCFFPVYLTGGSSPYQERFNFWGLVDYALRYPNVCIDDALRGVFTVPQIKQLKRNLKINSEIPVGTLSAQQWAIIHETMIKYVPKFRWPKVRKEKFYYLKR